MTDQLAILAIFVFLYSLVAGRVDRSVLSGPIIFVAAGFLMGPMGLGWLGGGESRADLRHLADLTLAIVLFTDAANSNLSILKRGFGIPTRLLLLGLPGSIALGFGLALVMFDVLTVFEAAILGTMLAATDAALGKGVFGNQAVPGRLREGLNVESGLNDGLCVPILFVFVALELATETRIGEGLVLKLLAEELGIGLLAGVGTAMVGSWLLGLCYRRGWVTPIWIQVTVAALAIACFAIAQSLGGSGYIAAFTGGMLVGHRGRGKKHDILIGAEGIGETLALLTWLMFGYAVIGQVFPQFTWPIFAYALLSLTVVRMLPVYLSMTGSGEPVHNRLFLGWFGPRGLASIVFAVIVLDRDLHGSEFIALVVTCTVFVSLVLHGVTANPLADWIARKEDDRNLGSE
jgi:NhaP-type Na+/H+ or K+/H+ antiporter